MTSSTIEGGTTSSGIGCPIPRDAVCPIPRGADTEDEEPRQSTSCLLRAEDREPCNIAQAAQRRQGALRFMDSRAAAGAGGGGDRPVPAAAAGAGGGGDRPVPAAAASAGDGAPLLQEDERE